ncbi:alpha/beta fold hydrolase [Mycobacterium florentinum]|nr:alpha/beta hydrolase [Mycobacterium florentinum]MCV7413270.1 alpha/beta hydrolase [Mycobacterium florentinum]BBX76798.1 3-oxoadipate enol-lactonase [Mycobacterium florentinum]
MSVSIRPQFTTIDGLSVRFAEGGHGDRDAILLSPWPESVYAFEPSWERLGAHAHLVAVDPPGFGKSDYRESLMNPKAMGDFIIRIADTFGLDHPHVVGPDIGTSSVLFAAAAQPGRFRSVVVGSGGAAVPIQVTGVLKDWVEATDLEPYRQFGGRKIVEIALSTIAGYAPSAEIREDYLSAYEGDRFAETIPYAQSYREYLPRLAELLPRIQTPVRIVAGADDQVVPPVNAEFLDQRLPHSRVDLIPGTGHFCWEEKPAEYAALVTGWWAGNGG